MFTVVCGKPGSGKTTFVRKNSGVASMVIDLDSIAAALNPAWGLHKDRPALVGDVLLRLREVLVRSGHSDIWLIVCSVRTALDYTLKFNGTCILCRFPRTPIQLR